MMAVLVKENLPMLTFLVNFPSNPQRLHAKHLVKIKLNEDIVPTA